MSNPQQPEIRRSDESPTTKQRTQDANPTSPPTCMPPVTFPVAYERWMTTWLSPARPPTL